MHRFSRETLATILVFLCIYTFMLFYFRPSLLLSLTTTSGGDTASHYYPAHYVKNYLLPHGKIIGWSQGWYAGMPMFQYYFPLPFALIALLSFLVPLQVAFKLITILGSFALPLAACAMLRMMKFEFPIPVIGAIFTLPFLFMQANSMWGGNIPSTLAGEFSFSISLALSLLFLGLVYRDSEMGKHWVRNAALFAAITLSHAITALWVAVATICFLVSKQWKHTAAYFFKVYALAFLLAAFWLVPLLATMSFTTTYADYWNVDLNQVFPLSIAAFFVLMPPALYLFRKDRRLAYLLWVTASAAALFFLAEPLGLINIRFAPFVQVLLLVIASLAFAVTQHGKRWLVPLLVLIVVVYWTAQHTTYIGFWVQWNYEGFENKQLWPAYKSVNEYLAGNENDPRVVYEHSQLHDQAGTPRAFESLPLFSGRSTLEGLYMQSSVSSPFIFYIQSEISEQNSCPFHQTFPCAQFSIEKATEHLKLFNVRHVIARSDKAKAALDRHNEYKLVHRSEPYSVYELTTNENRYVDVPAYEPVALETDDWKKDFYEWFKGDTNVPLVHTDDAMFRRTNSIQDAPRVPVENNCTIDERIANETITFTTSCVGKPHIVKISYHPNWVVDGAETIYLVSPSFMLVYPATSTVTLRYGTTAVQYAGYALSLAGIIAAVYCAARKRQGSGNGRRPRR
ncbi:MAG: hypothetical protein HYY37_03570 [Candidatus Aenigmarchaeota archaeon]|nr:hypothetical protein [Candidatus Aenigmarchaeota archaeon]